MACKKLAWKVLLMMQSEDRLKILADEVKNLQEIIKRMASNSLEIKKWAITLIVGTMILKSEQNEIFVALIPLFAFWFLDSYYLRQERLFRDKYNELIRKRMFSDEGFFDVKPNPKCFFLELVLILKICFSVSTLPFYGCILMVLMSINNAYGWKQVEKFTSISFFSKTIECVKTSINKEKTNEQS